MFYKGFPVLRGVRGWLLFSFIEVRIYHKWYFGNLIKLNIVLRARICF